MNRTDTIHKTKQPVINSRHQVVVEFARQQWYRSFAKSWRDCQLCPLHRHRTQVVQFRGKIPAPILFVGEAPGPSEDECGRPFVENAPAGKELETIFDEIGLQDEDYAIVNVVGCKPLDDVGEIRKPTKQEAHTCSPRLEALFEKIDPTLVVLMGDVAAKYATQFVQSRTTIVVDHPAHIARTQNPNDRKRFVLLVRQEITRLNLL